MLVVEVTAVMMAKNFSHSYFEVHIGDEKNITKLVLTSDISSIENKNTQNRRTKTCINVFQKTETMTLMQLLRAVMEV